MRWRLSGVAQRLVDAAGVGHDIGLSVNAISPRADRRQLAGGTLDATFALLSIGTTLTLRADGPRLATLAGRPGLAALALGADIADRTAFAIGAALTLRTDIAALASGTGLTLGSRFTTLADRADLAALSGGATFALDSLLAALATLALWSSGTDRPGLARRTALAWRAIAHGCQPGIDPLIDPSSQLRDLSPKLSNGARGLGLHLPGLRLHDLALAAPLAALVGDDLAEGLAERVRQHDVRSRLPR